jgi:threonine/homoserine/homoserine lactone efflux protein
MTTELLLAFIVFAFVTSITPGPNNLMLMTSGINFGFARTVPHMLGVAIGFTLMILLVGVGVTQVFDAIPGAYTAIRFASIAYLLYMAWTIAMTRPKPIGDGAEEGARKPFSFMQAVLFQWVNPKAWTMGLTAVSAYIPRDHPTLGLLIVSGVFGLITLPTVGSWTIMGVKMRRFLSDPAKMRAFNIIAALVLVATLYPTIFGTHVTR